VTATPFTALIVCADVMPARPTGESADSTLMLTRKVPGPCAPGNADVKPHGVNPKGRSAAWKVTSVTESRGGSCHLLQARQLCRLPVASTDMCTICMIVFS
jgi:hypothetical protein